MFYRQVIFVKLLVEKRDEKCQFEGSLMKRIKVAMYKFNASLLVFIHVLLVHDSVIFEICNIGYLLGSPKKHKSVL